jgi:phospholipid/cholesterol/gamma-HCH transport system ATP-binding protein
MSDPGSIPDAPAVLELLGARPDPRESPLRAALDLRLHGGELALVHAPDSGIARALAELCTGLPPLAAGCVRFQGQDWQKLSRPRAEALRGAIGLAPGDGGWLPHLSVEESMLLARQHHGSPPEAELRQQADELARAFGLEKGIPEARSTELSRPDLARAAAVRAFLGQPVLLLLESPLDLEVSDLLAGPVLAALRPALERGAGAIWVTRSRSAWEDPGLTRVQRLALSAGEGLVPIQGRGFWKEAKAA